MILRYWSAGNTESDIIHTQFGGMYHLEFSNTEAMQLVLMLDKSPAGV